MSSKKGKKSERQGASQQEKLVAAFARSSVSKNAVFHPDLFGNGREPADMIMFLGRTMFIVNMQSSKSYLQDMIEHNVRQARERISEWRGGKPIRGRNSVREFYIKYDDVDHIAVLSIVDGPHARCVRQDLSNLGLDKKVAICATLTSPVMYKVAEQGGGARDILRLCTQMLDFENRSSEYCIYFIDNTIGKIINDDRSKLQDKVSIAGNVIIYGKEMKLFDEWYNMLNLFKVNTDLGRWADLSWIEILNAVSFMASNIPIMEKSSFGQIRFFRHEGLMNFEVIISSNQKALTERIPLIFEMSKKEKIELTLFISLLNFGPICFSVPQDHGRPWAIDVEMESVRP